MRLGVVMMGAGAYAAANAGVLEQLLSRGIEPYAVCGVQAGAWPAALCIAGRSAREMRACAEQAARMGGRMLLPGCGLRRMLRGGGAAMTQGRRLAHLLSAQAGQRMLPACPGRGLFLCRTARSEQLVLFATQPFLQPPGALIAMQASVSFAARAAMALPPLLAPVQWMGSPLLPCADAALACRMLLAMGADCALVIAPQPPPGAAPDALELACAAVTPAGWAGALPPGAGVLRVRMPQGVGALDLRGMAACVEAGERAAMQGLDAALERLGLARCRILPFRAHGGR